MKRSIAALLFVLVACGDDRVQLSPTVEVPPPDSNAYPYLAIDELVLSVARLGSDEDIVLARAAIGEELTLDGVPFGDQLVVHLSGRTAGVEVAYGRTCPVTVPADERHPEYREPSLYLSRIVRWGPGAEPIVTGRVGGSGYALPDGSALFVGGGVDATALEVFDPLTGLFSALEGTILPRDRAAVAPIGDQGAAVIVGGVDGAGDAVASAELVSPGAIDAESQVEVQTGPPLVDHAAAPLVDGSVIVVGGSRQAEAGAAFEVTGEAWLFAVQDGGLAPPEQLATALATPRRNHSMTRLGDEVGADVLIVGGRDETGAAVATAELYRPLRDAFEPVREGPLGESAALQVPRWGHVSVRLPGGFVLVVGGVTGDGNSDPVPVRELELYDPVQGLFSPAGDLPAAAGVTELTATALPDGRVLLAGGRDLDGAPVASAFIARFDPIDGRVDLSATDGLQVERSGHTAVSLCDGTILVVGGASSAGVQVERYNPPSTGRR